MPSHVCMILNRSALSGTDTAQSFYACLVPALIQGGWRITLLDTSPANASIRHVVKSDLRHPLLSYRRLDSFPESPFSSIHPRYLSQSHRILRALESLHCQAPIDLVQFPEYQAPGFRTVQGIISAGPLEGLRSLVILHGSSRQQRIAAERWMANEEDARLDYCERWSFENAHAHASLCPAFLSYAHDAGWEVSPKTQVFHHDRESLLANLQFYERCVDPVARKQTDVSGSPLVSVTVTHYNLGKYLPKTLHSLAAQTYPNLAVSVIDDGSTDPFSINTFDRMQAKYSQFQFVRQPNRGLSEARNAGLRLANGPFFIPVDADNIMTPHMVERLVHALMNNPNYAAMTCFCYAFRDDSEIRKGKFIYDSQPTAGPQVLGSVMNVYGDSNAIYRVDAMRAIGGYETVANSTCEDWEVFVKLIQSGHEIGVVPEYLFYYRHREDSLLRTTSPHLNQERILRAYSSQMISSRAERLAIWDLVTSQFLRHRRLRYRLADMGSAIIRKCPPLHRLLLGALEWIPTTLRRNVWFKAKAWNH